MIEQTWARPQSVTRSDGEVEVRALDAARDVDELFEISHGSADKEAVWKYLPAGPFASPDEMRAWLEGGISVNPVPFVVRQLLNGAPRVVGMLAIMEIVPEHGRAEIGCVMISAGVQRAGVNTRAQFLILKYLLDELKYRRVEWKCNAENAVSRYAAHRMGFVYEGRFRHHMVVRGRSRDTDWFSLTDKDWPRARVSFEAWIESGGSLSLGELNHG